MDLLRLEYRNIDDLKRNANNARLHSDKQLHQIAASIRAFGFNAPVLIDDQGQVLAGHGRLEGAKLAGLTQVPVVCLSHLTSAARKRAFALADNKIGLNASWDLALLKQELQALDVAELDFDVEVTGFDAAEVDLLVDAPTASVAAEDAMLSLEEQAVALPGDVWQLGEHRLICGDALEPASYQTLMGDERAKMVFTDPPYNVAIDGNVSGHGAIVHREFEMGSGELTPEQFTGFLGTAFANMAAVSVDGAVHFISMDWRHLEEMLAAARHAHYSLLNLCVWNKTNGGMGSFYRSKHELVFVYKVGTAQHLNTIELGRHGRYRTNVWDYAGINVFRAGREAELKMHPTVKPAALIVDAIKDCSRRGDIVLDPFVGSGTTIIAAEKSRRIARAIEIDPHYVDVAIRRWRMVTGQTARLIGTNEEFDEVETRRGETQDPKTGSAGSPGGAR